MRGARLKQLAHDTPQDAARDVAIVISALKKEELPTNMRVWAVRQLGEFDPSLAKPPLVAALRDSNPEVVEAAIRTLGRLGDASTLPDILKLKQHPDPRVQAAVQEVAVQVR